MYTVRQGNPADVPQLARLRALWSAEQEPGPVPELTATGGMAGGGARDGLPDGFEEDFRHWAEGNPREFFVAEEGGELIGMVNLLIFERMPKPGKGSSCWVYLGNAYVLPRHRSAGAGTALMQAAMAFARDLGAVRMVLAPSPESADFYARLGFGPASELAVHRFT